MKRAEEERTIATVRLTTKGLSYTQEATNTRLHDSMKDTAGELGMLRFKSREEINRLKEKYPKGTKIMLDHMDDPYNPTPSGTVGTVEHVDDMGQIHWTGSSLALVPGVDRFHILKE